MRQFEGPLRFDIHSCLDFRFTDAFMQFAKVYDVQFDCAIPMNGLNGKIVDEVVGCAQHVMAVDDRLERLFKGRAV